MAVVPGKRIYEGTRIPSPVPTILEVDPEKHDLDGEAVAGIRAVIGYLHTGFEKTMEQKSWWKSMTYPARVDYLYYVRKPSSLSHYFTSSESDFLRKVCEYGYACD